MTGLKITGPRNQLGELATKTPEETITRLMAKVSKNRGTANRERIRAQISQSEPTVERC